MVALAVDQTAEVVFAGTVSGNIWRLSSARWENVYASPPGTFQPVITRLLVDGSRVLAAGRALLVSEDGQRFRDLTAGLGDTPADIVRRGRFGIGAIAVVKSTTVAAVVSDFVPEGGLWLYDLASGHWRRASALPRPGSALVIAGYSASLFVATAAGSAWSSADAGVSWTDISDGLAPREPMELSGSPYGLVVGTDHGALTLGAARWEPLGTTAPPLIRAVAIVEGVAFLGADDGLWRVALP